MKVLIITYYWPPAGGSGVQRWLKFAKYLRDFDIEPIIYTPKNPSYPVLDPTLSDEIPVDVEVIKEDIFEPNQFFSAKKKKQSGGHLETKPNFAQRFLRYVRANYFIPDARKFWIKPSIHFLSDYLNQNPVDVIITTGPPHSLHLIALGLKKKLNIKWIADFRDPWINIDYFHQLPLSSSSINKHKSLEKEVVSQADKVIVVGKSMKADYLKFNSDISVISNGFDDFSIPKNIELDKKFTIVHIGLLNADRNPISLWKALSELAQDIDGFREDLSISLIGSVSKEVKSSLSVLNNISHELVPYLNHNDVRKRQLTAQVLLLCINNVPFAKGIVTGKIFEYLQVNRPILAIGPEDGDASEILKKTNAGVCIGFDNKEDIKNHILALYKEFKKGNLISNSSNIEQYHRRNLTKKLKELIEDTVNLP